MTEEHISTTKPSKGLDDIAGRASKVLDKSNDVRMRVTGIIDALVGDSNVSEKEPAEIDSGGNLRSLMFSRLNTIERNLDSINEDIGRL